MGPHAHGQWSDFSFLKDPYIISNTRRYSFRPEVYGDSLDFYPEGD